ncbi:hypothetical protein CIHG_08799 [Coccidioides immitis H538.4]|uniref:Uncharacterized protein n=3 Tax=Coccidioides immitis TaxID=5501 RepID=A0A0J8TUM9_COCIT|nr:hypothetical protein CIRG_04694 [Coccidioides immitis RMSCC 2394]KMU77537.1 hypothetical protein CISG_01295 [Coccidioides immitis RMSCC 3703]KMU90943.1 hypothetical protein CIHG_08799 [Coccidioides immitis H538.4]
MYGYSLALTDVHPFSQGFPQSLATITEMSGLTQNGNHGLNSKSGSDFPALRSQVVCEWWCGMSAGLSLQQRREASLHRQSEQPERDITEILNLIRTGSRSSPLLD